LARELFTCSDLLRCHLDRLVGIAEIDLSSRKCISLFSSRHMRLSGNACATEAEIQLIQRSTHGDVESLICPLPEDDTSQTRIRREHSRLCVISTLRLSVITNIGLRIFCRLYLGLAIGVVADGHDKANVHQVGGHESGHPKR